VSELESQLANVGGGIQAAIDAGTALAEPKKIADIYAPHVVLVPEGGRAEVLDLGGRFEKFAERPRRATGQYTAATVEAFNAYVNEHLDPTATTVWVHPTEGTIVAILNDHGDGQDAPAWRDWKVTLDLRHTDEWLHWKKRDGVLGGQEDFAEHIEDGLTEIVSPAGADLLEIAQTFHATSSAQFRQAIRLQDGRTQFRYDEEVDARAGTSGELAIPQEIKLVLSPYVGEPAVELIARLRYRVSGGNLRIGYKLDRPERVVRSALEDVAERIEAQFGDHVYLGSPPA
jgi:uncharacterized protein YfdQ (DUF2303 family)